MDGLLDRWRKGWMEEVKKISFTAQTPSLSLSLIGALISHTPALNGDAGERNTVEANRYHDLCNN